MTDVTVVIPTLNEAARIAGMIARLNDQGATSVVVADGGSEDRTVDIARAAGARVVSTPPGRGAQLARGIEAVQTDGVWVVHADTRLPEDGVRQVAAALDEAPFGAFRLVIDHPARVYRVIEFGVELRVRLFRLVYGDQAMFFRRRAYLDVGGFPDVPLMEDVALCQRFRRVGIRPRVLPAAVATDARRWERDGPWRRTFGNWSLLFRYLVLRQPADRLAKYYRPERPAQ